MISSTMFSEVSKMNLEQLRELNSFVISCIKDVRATQAYNVKNKLRVGDNVTVNHPKTYGMKGIVKEIRRTKASVKFGNTTFNVPIGLIQISK